MAFGFGTDRLADDTVRGVIDASAAAIRMVQNRPRFAAVLAGSFALHFLALLLIVLLESAPAAKPDATVEIPVELVSAPPTDGAGVTGSGSTKAEAAKAQNAPDGQQQAEKPAAKPAQQAAKAEPKPTQPAAKPVEQAAAQKPPPPAPTPKTADNKPPPPIKPPEPPKAEPPKQAAASPAAKPASPPPEPPKQVAAAQKPAPQPEPAKPSAPATPSPAAQPPAAQTPPTQPAQTPLVPPPTLAALPPPESPSSELGGRSPLGLMQDDWRAVAVPKPSADGDEELSYKTVVFGMLELNKRFPEDARARGATGSSTVYFELNDDGTVKTVKLLESSGDVSLDVESLAIVMRSSPFPKPPAGAQKIFAATIEFNPHDH